MLNPLMAMAEQRRYITWVNEQEQQRQTARILGKKECQRCGHCCLRRTCIPTPDELPAIAAHLGLSVEDLIRTYMVGDGNITFFLRFANTAQKAIVGTFLDPMHTYDKGQCLLYDESARECLIYPVRPEGARVFQCWEKNPVYRKVEDAGWNDGQAERLAPWMEFCDDEDGGLW